MLKNKKKLRRLERRTPGNAARAARTLALATALTGSLLTSSLLLGAPGAAQAAPTEIGGSGGPGVTWDAAAATANPEGFTLIGRLPSTTVTTTGDDMTGPGNVNSLTITGTIVGSSNNDVSLDVVKNLVITDGLSLSGADRTAIGSLKVGSGKSLTAGATAINAYGVMQLGMNGDSSSSLNGSATLGSLTIAANGTLYVGGEGGDNDAAKIGGKGELNVLGDMTVHSGLTLGGTGGAGNSANGGTGGEGTLTVDGNFSSVGALTIGGAGGGGSSGKPGGDGGAGVLTLTGALNTFEEAVNLGGTSGSASGGDGGTGGEGTLNLAGGVTTFADMVSIGATKGDATNSGAKGNVNVYGGASALFQGDVQVGAEDGGNATLQLGANTGAGTATLAAGASLSFKDTRNDSLLLGGKAGSTNGGDGTLNVYGTLMGANGVISVGGMGADGAAGAQAAQAPQGGQGVIHIKKDGKATFDANQVIGGTGGEGAYTTVGDGGAGGAGIVNIEADAGNVVFDTLTVGGKGGEGFTGNGGTGGDGVLNVYKKNQEFAGVVTLGGAAGTSAGRGAGGAGGSGTLHVFDGASVSFGDTTTGVQIGAASALGGKGELYVHSGGAVTSAGDIKVGSTTSGHGDGLLHIADGGSVVLDAGKAVNIVSTRGSSSRVSTQAYTVGNSGTTSGTGGLTADIVNINGATLEVRGDLSLKAEQLGNSVASGINVANGGGLEVQGKLTLASTSAVTGTWVGGVTAQHLDVGAQDFTLSGGTLTLQGTGKDFLTAKSLTLTNSAALMLGDSSVGTAQSGGAYDGKITVGGGSTLGVDPGAWSVQQLAVGTSTSTGIALISGHLTIMDKTRGALNVAAGAQVNILQGGTLQVYKDTLLDGNYGSVIGGKLFVDGGGVLKIDGYTDLSLTNAQTIAGSLLNPVSSGLIDYGPKGVALKPGDFHNAATHPLLAGTLQSDKVEGSFVLLKDHTVGYEAPTGTTPGISTGGFGAKSLLVQTDANATAVTITTSGGLTLIGGAPSDSLVGVTGASNPADVKTHIIVGADQSLNLGSAGLAGGGTLNGNVTLSGTGAAISSLNVTNGQYTVGAITGALGDRVNISGGKLSATQVGSTSGKLLLSISSGMLSVSGPTYFGGIRLNNGVIETTGADGDLDVGNILISGQSNALYVSHDLTVNSFTSVDGSSGNTLSNTLNNTLISVGGDMNLHNAMLAENVILDVKGTLTATGHNISLDKGSLGQVGSLALDSGTLTLDGNSWLELDSITTSGAISVNGASELVVQALNMDNTGNVQLQKGSTMQVEELTTGTSGAGKVIRVGDANDATGSTLVVDKLVSTGGIAVFVGSALATSAASFSQVKAVDKSELADAFIAGRNGIVSFGQHSEAWVKQQAELSGMSPQSALALALPLTLNAGGQLLVGEQWDAAGNWAGGSTPTTHAVDVRGNSLIVADVTGLKPTDAGLTLSASHAVNIDSTAGITLHADNLQANQSYTLMAGINALGQQDISRTLANGDSLQLRASGTKYLLIDNDFVYHKGSAANDGTLVAHTSLVRAQSVMPQLSDAMGSFLDGMALYSGFDSRSVNAGTRFVSRALDSAYIGARNPALAASTIEGAAQMGAVAGVQITTIGAAGAASGAVTTRTSFAQPRMDTTKAVAVHQDADGSLSLDSGLSAGNGMKNGLGVWIMPLYQSNKTWGQKAENYKTGMSSDLGGIALGADYTINDMFRFGAAFNVGGGYAQSSGSGGDFNKTENNFNFWGVNLYGGWAYNNFGLSGDVGYTSNYNKVQQELPSALQMGDLKADVTSAAWTAGVKAEYKIETSVLDIIPHVGVRYMGLTTNGYDVENGGTVFSVEQDFQSIWTFPVGVAFSKTITTDSGWQFTPQVDLSVIPAAGDIKAKSTSSIPGVPGSTEMKMQVVDYVTFDGGVGFEVGKDNVSFGINYNIQASEHRTGHGVFGTLRYEF